MNSKNPHAETQSPPLIGVSKNIIKIRELIKHIADTGLNILISGETGAGKEVVAQNLYAQSNRNDKPFLKVNCAALPEGLLESELYGHERGAFTGAERRKKGKFELADSGVLFLDEIGDMSLSLQSKLLHVLQSGVFAPLGSEKDVKTDTWVIAATNHNLESEIRKKKFREDLFYRLNVVVLQVPPLKDRMDDVALLAKFFVKNFVTDFSTVKDISKEALICLQNYRWPGNIRELENVIRRAIALGNQEFIQPEDLPPSIVFPPGKATLDNGRPAEDSLEAYEKAAIQNALAKSRNSRRKAAEMLGIAEATLYRKITKYGLIS